MAAVPETTVKAAVEGKQSDLRSFLAKRGVAVDTAEVDDQALKDLDKKYIIARDLDADTVLSKIQNVVGLTHKEDSIIAYEGLSYQLPSRDLEQQEYDPLLQQLCLRRGKVDRCTVGDPKTSRWARVITAVLSFVQEELLSDSRTSSEFLRHKDELFKRRKKTVDDALLDICCLLGCSRKSLNLYERIAGMVIGPLILTRDDGIEIDVRLMGLGGARIQEGLSKITVTPGAEARSGQLRQELGCVIITGGDGQLDITTRAFLCKLKDSLCVPVYALVNPSPEGLSIFCTYKFGSSEGPFDNVGLTVPDIKWIGVHLGDALDIENELQLRKKARNGLPLTKKDISILEGLCAKNYVMGDEVLRTNIQFMMQRGFKNKIEALYYRQYPPIDYTREAVNNQEDI